MCAVWAEKAYLGHTIFTRMMLSRSLLLLLLVVLSSAVQAQISSDTDEIVLRKLYDEALVNGESYENLRVLCKDVGARLSGSPEADKAVEWGEAVLNKLGLDRVFLQEIEVPVWVRGAPEECYIPETTGETIRPLKVCALGGSISTPPQGLESTVVEVQHFDDLEKLGREAIEGKIVFFNRPMDPRNIVTFKSYGGCVDQRSQGAIEAAQFGAIGVLVRSMNLRDDDFPHTGSMRYSDEVDRIPSAAISTNDANYLSERLKKEPDTRVFIRMSCRTLPNKKSYNVIGELKGSEHPERIIVVGGHLDSWDLGEGAHDDGAGCVQSIEVLRLFKATGVRPKNTIRAVLFMNEENGNNGGRTYAKKSKEEGLIHLAALESDRGGFSPRGFSVDADDLVFSNLKTFEKKFKPYDANAIEKGYGGVDIGPLKEQGVPLIGLVPDSQRYFDHHHSDNDVFEEVNKRELELGGAAMASLIYLIDKYGVEFATDPAK